MRLRPSAVLASMVMVMVSACGGDGADVAAEPGVSPDPEVAVVSEGVVLRVEHVGGFLPPSLMAARLPIVSVYADGRVFSDGPVPAIYPGPALPNVQVRQIDQAGLATLAQRAVAAGVGSGFDLGEPPIADVPSTRVTLATQDGPLVTEAAALEVGNAVPGPALTEEQRAARSKLVQFLDALRDLDATLSPGTVGAIEQYVPESLAVVSTPWVSAGDGLDTQPDVAWPGPPLPGEALMPALQVSCLTVTGEEARAVWAAAANANAATPWTSGGARWSLSFRPLLPDEASCSDLLRS